MIEFLKTRFDVVLIDAPPLLPVTDAAVLSKSVDGVVLVVRDGKTARGEVAQAAESLRQVNANLLGTVRNFVPMKSLTYGYGYGYGSEAPLEPTKPLANVIDLRDRPGQHQVDVTTTSVEESVG